MIAIVDIPAKSTLILVQTLVQTLEWTPEWTRGWILERTRVWIQDTRNNQGVTTRMVVLVVELSFDG